jgi:hypothetical protein
MDASVADLARTNGVSEDAVRVLQDAVRRGGGRQAQFSHPDLGGMGQWSAGGMTQVGDMFNTSLKDKVNAICSALAESGEADKAPAPAPTGGSDWWPDGLGQPSSTGSQNGMRYATFPDSHRVVVEQAGRVTVYDSGDHRISGVSQQQSGTQELTFSSQKGSIRASDLPVAR